MASLKEVAEKAGVSVSTVSYVLNGKKKVKEETLERIRAAVEETGYVTNTLARSLREGRSRTIGLIIPNAIEYTWEDIITGAERCLESKGYHIVCSICRNDALREEKSVANFLEQKVDGIILVGISDPDRIRALAGDLPVVYVERTLSDRYSYVDMDYLKVAGIAVMHLFDCGKSAGQEASVRLRADRIPERHDHFRDRAVRRHHVLCGIRQADHPPGDAGV